MRFLPLVDDVTYRGSAGWCTYASVLEDGADVEIICGGMNTKHPEAAGIWRQGNLLHFGFQPDPSTFNDTGRALLENCIVYIARFTEDRPIGHTPSVFVDSAYPRPRYYLRRALDSEDATAEGIAGHFAKSIRAPIAALAPEDARSWASARFAFLVAGADGLLEVDEDAHALGIGIDDVDFVRTVAAELDQPDHTAHALRTLARRVPDGPGADADPAAWKAFIEQNADFLFFSEIGGQHWWLDPLAQARGVASRDLRGPRRATSAGQR